MATARIDDFTKKVIEDESKAIQLTIGGQTYDFASVRSLIAWIRANLADQGMFRGEGISLEVQERASAV